MSKAADSIIISSRPAISFITRIELLAWPQISKAQEEMMNGFISTCYIYGCEELVIMKTIEGRKLYKLKLPDAFIAATALVYDLTLLSRNLKDFKGIENLLTIDPSTL